MSHHSKYHFITQYIYLRGIAVNEFYRMIRMGVAGHVKATFHSTIFDIPMRPLREDQKHDDFLPVKEGPQLPLW